MAYRKVHDRFWTDPDLEEFTPEQKYFYLYLITNPRVNQIGLYEFSIRHACLETGYNEETIYKLLEIFEEAGKIMRSQVSKELVVIKFWHHNRSDSPKVRTHVRELINNVKDTLLIQYIYGLDTKTQEEEEKEETKHIIKRKEELPFATDLFFEIWNKWESFRREIRKPLTKRSIEMQFSFLKTQNERNAIAIIEKSILNGWQGLFPIKEEKKTGGNKYPDYYDANLARKLSPPEWMEYKKKLIELGWTENNAPGGTVWNKPKSYL